MLVPVLTILSMIKFPFPVELFPLQEIDAEGWQELKPLLKEVPEQVVIVLKSAVTSGVGFIVMFLDDKPVTTLPQASVTVGGGTFNTVTVSQMVGQPGIVNVSCLLVWASEHPIGPFTVWLPVAQG